jgi:hypothetical protein
MFPTQSNDECLKWYANYPNQIIKHNIHVLKYHTVLHKYIQLLCFKQKQINKIKILRKINQKRKRYKNGGTTSLGLAQTVVQSLWKPEVKVCGVL